MKRCKKGGNFIRLLYLLTELFKFEIQNVVKFCVHISPIFSCRVTIFAVFKNIICYLRSHKIKRDTLQCLIGDVDNETVRIAYILSRGLFRLDWYPGNLWV